MKPEEWMPEYHRARYLREADDVALQQRFDDLANNLWSTGPDGKVTPPRSPHVRKGILRLLFHTMLEQNERRRGGVLEFDECAIREMSSANYAPPQLKSPFVGSPICYAKFGKREHIRDAIGHGVLRIAPASSYDDPSLNPAQIDKELEHYTVTPNKRLMMKMYGMDAEGNEIELPVQEKEFFQFLMVQDFYVWCCGLGYDARLFREFKACAVLVIRDKSAFRSRLAAAMADKVPTGQLKDGPLGYYDPYTSRCEQIVPIFSKHLRYLYQNEYRFAWTVEHDTALEPILVELGPLYDVAEILELE